MRSRPFGLVLASIGLVALSHAQSLTSVPHSPLIGVPNLVDQYQAFDTAGDVAAQANGALAVASVEEYVGHNSSEINDGMYGNGRSWIPEAPNAWLKIAFPTAMPITSLTFGRDRLGQYDDRDPGRFTIAVSLADNGFANGNDTNDALEYTTIFDSDDFVFSGLVDGPETLKATFATTPVARYVKMTFANSGVAIDEVEIEAVPEPGTMVALGLGAAAILRRRKRA